MNKYELIAETSNGATIHHAWVCGESEKIAREKFWNELTDSQRNATASIDCIETTTTYKEGR